MEICDVCGSRLEKIVERHPYGSTTADEIWWECTNMNCGFEEEYDEE